MKIKEIFSHQDTLHELTQKSSLHDKLTATHHSIKEIFPFIVRISIAIYDSQTKVLKTFVDSSGENHPLDHYQSLLDDAPSLKSVYERGAPRVVNDLDMFKEGKNKHTKQIKAQCYAASYTMPIYNEGLFIGFLFFNSDTKNIFDENVLRQLDIYGHLISLLMINEFSSIQTLTAAIKTTGNLSHVRDPETGGHLDRMSRYSRLIANALADRYKLNDAYIEHIFMYAPLHDIGKIGIPDRILLKDGPLNEEEWHVMQTHARIGREMIDDLLENFGLVNFEDVNILRNIAEFHHEKINGTGYPTGIKSEQIPLEARIVAVADVFDALTSIRCYKEAWSNEKAIETLKSLAGESLDKECVMALLENIDHVIEIQKRFAEDNFG
ncbi:MAG: HD domain-containing protein [Sulfuricurvum sp.]|nr:HD domain-containing protein [Sulfuricurvum sp.]